MKRANAARPLYNFKKSIRRRFFGVPDPWSVIRDVWSAAALQAKNGNDIVGLRECIRPLCELLLWALMECRTYQLFSEAKFTSTGRNVSQCGALLDLTLPYRTTKARSFEQAFVFVDAAYFTVAVTTFCHFWPAVLTASTLKRWLPAARLMVVLSCLLDVAVNFFTPSTHSSIRAIVPLTVEAAFTTTGELTVEPLVGAQMCTPFEDGALHAVR